jgi:hypothetical protein
MTLKQQSQAKALSQTSQKLCWQQQRPAAAAGAQRVCQVEALGWLVCWLLCLLQQWR